MGSGEEGVPVAGLGGEARHLGGCGRALHPKWASLGAHLEALYQDVMSETFNALVSAARTALNPHLVAELEQGEKVESSPPSPRRGVRLREVRSTGRQSSGLSSFPAGPRGGTRVLLASRAGPHSPATSVAGAAASAPTSRTTRSSTI